MTGKKSQPTRNGGYLRWSCVGWSRLLAVLELDDLPELQSFYNHWQQWSVFDLVGLNCKIWITINTVVTVVNVTL